MIFSVSDLFKDRIVEVELVGGMEDVSPIFLSFDIKVLRDEFTRITIGGDYSNIANACVSWRGINNKSVRYLASIFIEQPDILPDSEEDWPFSLEDCQFIFKHINQKPAIRLFNKAEEALRAFVAHTDEIYKIIEVFIRFESNKFTPKRCECLNPEAEITWGEDDALSCNCCVHLAKTGEWERDNFCKDKCIRSRFPSWAWGLWELCGLSMTRVSAGMSVTVDIGIDKFSRFVRKTGVEDLDRQDEIYELCRLMLYKWDELKEGKLPFYEEEVKKLIELENGLLNKER